MPTPVKSGLRLGGLWRLVLTVTYALVRYTVCIPNIILRTENNNRQRPPLGGTRGSTKMVISNSNI